jgi:hypothetical protein
MPLHAYAIETSKAFPTHSFPNLVLPRRMPEQQCRLALTIMQAEDDKVERMDPRAKQLPTRVAP